MKDSKQILIASVTGLIGVLTILAIVIGIGQIKILGTERYQGYNTISVVGTGESTAIPDIAKFGYTIESEKKTVAEAQEIVAKKSNDLIAQLKTAGIDEKDIKTDYYSSYPKYDYQPASAKICTPEYCPPVYGKQVLSGYVVTHTLSVKVRDVKKVGAIAQLLGDAGVTNISGPNFEVDDTDAVRNKAREEAIADAQEQAKILAKTLGVRLGKLISYTDPADSIYPMFEGDMMMSKAYGAEESSVTPELPTGESTTSVTVMLTYRIK